MLSLSLLRLLPLLLVTAGFAAPSFNYRKAVPAQALLLPAAQNALVGPNTPPKFTTLGVGTQNYTCTPSGNYSSIGAVVLVLDISHLHPTPLFWEVQLWAFNVFEDFPSDNAEDPDLFQLLNEDLNMPKLGLHYFVNQNGSLAPVWDFRADGPNEGNPDAIVFAEVTGNFPAPTGNLSVDWLELKGVSGELADNIFRVYTVGGAPPDSCKPGSEDIKVKFTTQYYLYGGSAGQ